MKKNLLALGFLLITAVSWASSDEINSLRIHSNSGKNILIVLEENPVIRFDGNDFVITSATNVINLPSDEVIKFTYEYFDPNGVERVDANDIRFSFIKESLNVSNLEPNVDLSIYTVDGLLISSATTDGNGCASLRLPGVDASIYVLKTPSFSFKIRRL